MNKILGTKILIVEDEILISDYIFELLDEEKFTNIKVANEEIEALNLMETFVPDIILMDINLNGTNSGLKLAKNKNRGVSVIFVTGQHDLALMNEAFNTNPHAYLTKPIKKVDLLASISLAIHKKENSKFQFKDGYDSVSLDYSDINYIVAEGNYSTIYTTSKKYTIRQALITISDQLDSKTFKRSHRSYIINSQKIKRITSQSIYIGDIEIPLSRTYAKQFK
ncbi:LytR/AlgR family response regulator transcription factor [Bizionia sp. KMM 8389]